MALSSYGRLNFVVLETNAIIDSENNTLKHKVF